MVSFTWSMMFTQSSFSFIFACVVRRRRCAPGHTPAVLPPHPRLRAHPRPMLAVLPPHSGARTTPDPSLHAAPRIAPRCRSSPKCSAPAHRATLDPSLCAPRFRASKWNKPPSPVPGGTSHSTGPFAMLHDYGAKCARIMPKMCRNCVITLVCAVFYPLAKFTAE